MTLCTGVVTYVTRGVLLRTGVVACITGGVPLCTDVVTYITEGATVRSGQLLLAYQLYPEK